MGGANIAGMVRKWRVEYNGAAYHVINRSDYRTWVFQDEGARDAFGRDWFTNLCAQFGSAGPAGFTLSIVDSLVLVATGRRWAEKGGRDVAALAARVNGGEVKRDQAFVRCGLDLSWVRFRRSPASAWPATAGQRPA